MASNVTPLPQIVIQSRRRWRSIDLAELWRYRELLWILASRDLKSRYRQSMLGAAWMLVQPLLTLMVFSFLFRAIGSYPTSSQEIPYSLSILCTLLAWGLFATTLGHVSNSLSANTSLLTKIYCPRLLFPLSCMLIAICDFCIGLLVLVGAMVYWRVAPSWNLVLLPFFIAAATLCGLSVGLWISALSVRRRDLRFAVPSLLQLWFFSSPVVYDISAVIPKKLQLLYSLNPMTGILEGFRWSLLGTDSFSWSLLATSAPAFLVLLITGLYYFRRAETEIADHI